VLKWKKELTMVYKFTETKDVKFHTNLVGHSYSSDWITIYLNGCIIVHGSRGAGYSWDGCSPKFKLFGKILGTPDGKSLGDYPVTYYASMLHDVLYQNKSKLPFSRLQVDLVFKDMLEKVGFEYTNVYYFFVRKFGGLYGSWKVK